MIGGPDLDSGDTAAMSHAGIDSLLMSLGEPSTVERRLEILEQLIAYWHGVLDQDLRRSDAELRGLPTPRPLRWLYERGVDRALVFSRQNVLLGPEKREWDADHLLFYVENQGVYLWATAEEEHGDATGQLRLPLDGEKTFTAIDRTDDDPSVWGRFSERPGHWEREDVRLSEFLIQACLFEAIFTAPHGAWVSWSDQDRLDRVTAPLRPLPLGAWRWPAYPARFWVGGGVFVFACPNGPADTEQTSSIWVGAKIEEPLHYLKMMDRSWEYKTF